MNCTYFSQFICKPLKTGVISKVIPILSAIMICLQFTPALCADPLNNTTDFVKQQYRDFLNREAETGGLQYWVNIIDSGAMTRAQVIDSFFWSEEFGVRIAPIVRLYFAYFLRIPDYGGLMYWIDAYNSGASLWAISDSFAGSEEFRQRYGSLSNEAFVELIYHNILGRAPDPGGYVFWVMKLNSGQQTRGQVMTGFSESAEYESTSSNEVFVTMMYVGMLRRSPDEGGFDFWVNYLDSGGSGLALIDGFLNSQEYANRFLAQCTLTVQKAGSGSGTVTGGGINCGSTCSKSLPSGTQVTLTATASTTLDGISYMLASWSGCDSSNANQCTVTMTQNKTVTATFATPYTLTVNKSGTGSGTVTGGGINCGSTCSKSLPSGTQVTLTATASSGSTFMSWSGCDSSNANQCTVTMNQNKTPTAAFAQGVMITIQVISAPGSTGSILWNGAFALPASFKPCPGNDCLNATGCNPPYPLPANNVACTPMFLDGSTIQVYPLNPPGATFSGWSGCDSVIPFTNMNNQAVQKCVLTVKSNRVITVIFNSICPAGDNWCSGTCISSNDPLNCGICGRDCTQYDKVTQVQAYYACTQGRCTFNGCKPGWTSCYGTNTCDTKTDTDINNCGGCRQACPQPWSSGIGCPGTWDAVVIIEGRGPTSSYQCVNGACVGICCPNFATCDSSEGQCTTDLRGDINNCGRCGHECGGCTKYGVEIQDPCMFGNCISNPACWFL